MENIKCNIGKIFERILEKNFKRNIKKIFVNFWSREKFEDNLGNVKINIKEFLIELRKNFKGMLRKLENFRSSNKLKDSLGNVKPNIDEMIKVKPTFKEAFVEFWKKKLAQCSENIWKF